MLGIVNKKLCVPWEKRGGKELWLLMLELKLQQLDKQRLVGKKSFDYTIAARKNLILHV